MERKIFDFGEMRFQEKKESVAGFQIFGGQIYLLVV